MATYSSVACDEEFGSRSESFDLESGIEASVTLRCAWANRHALVADVLSGTKQWPHGSWTQPPVGVSASIKPEKDKGTASGQSIDSSTALVTVKYSTKIKDLINETLEPNAEFLLQDYKRFRWGSATGDPLLEGEAPGKLFRGLNIVRTIYYWAPPLPISLLEVIGHVNYSSYTSAQLGLTFPPETLLYQPPQLERVVKSDGSVAITATLKFSYKPDTWNKYWRGKSQQYEEIFDVNGATAFKSYQPGDFSAFLF